MNRILTILDEYSWLRGLPPSVCWAWCMFYDYVSQHGRPAGHTAAVGVTKWCERLDCSPSDFNRMIDMARQHRAVDVYPTTRGSKFVIPNLVNEVGDKARRMRKKRARDRGDEPGEDGLPCFTRSDALAIRRRLNERGFKTEKLFPNACVHVMNAAVTAKIKNPVGKLEAFIDRFINKYAGEMVRPNSLAMLEIFSAEITRNRITVDQLRNLSK